jgi:hypothetical protein
MSQQYKPLIEPLPAGERILWQGKPTPAAFLKQIFHVQLVIAYVGLLLGWCLMTGVETGQIGHAVVASLRFAGLSAIAVGMFGGLAWGLARSTTYTITNARVVFEYGLAMPKALSIPFASVDAASLRETDGRAGDLVLVLRRGQRVSYALLWPHVRPGSFWRGEPMLRALTDVPVAAQTLSRALAASAGLNPVPITASAPAPDRGAIGVAA